MKLKVGHHTLRIDHKSAIRNREGIVGFHAKLLYIS